MAIVETAWEKFLESDSEVPPDVFFLVKGEDEGIGKDSSRTIGAHKNFLAGVSPVFRRMLFGPLKESKDVIEVKDTTFEAFNTMILYIYKRPNLPFFPAPFKPRKFMFRRAPTFESELFPTKTLVPKRSNSDKKQRGKYPLVFSESSVSFQTEVSQKGVWPVNPFSEAEAEAEASRFVTPTRKQRIQCPQNFFDLLNLAEMYELESMKQELTGFVDVLDITDNNVMFTTRVAKSYQNIVAFEEVSIRLLANCLKFLLKRTDRGGDMWTKFWALINNSENSEVELRQCISLQEKLFGTPISISHAVLRKTVYQLDNLGTYDECLYLACSGVHVSDNIEIIDRGLDIMVKEMKKKQRISSLSSQFSGGRHASQEPREYKVRIEQNQTHWIFTCSCCLRERPIPICKLIGACMLVHFH